MLEASCCGLQHASQVPPVGSGQPQPYHSDLAYLEDQFQLIETLVKARKMETSDDSFLLRPDQRKPEAVVRELRAKGRGLQAKVERKMEATRKNGGRWGEREEGRGKNVRD